MKQSWRIYAVKHQSDVTVKYLLNLTLLTERNEIIDNVLQGSLCYKKYSIRLTVKHFIISLLGEDRHRAKQQASKYVKCAVFIDKDVVNWIIIFLTINPHL